VNAEHLAGPIDIWAGNAGRALTGTACMMREMGRLPCHQDRTGRTFWNEHRSGFPSNGGPEVTDDEWSRIWQVNCMQVRERYASAKVGSNRRWSLVRSTCTLQDTWSRDGWSVSTRATL
jgi:hypothetical protein